MMNIKRGKIKRIVIFVLAFFLLLALTSFFFYFNNIRLVNTTTSSYYKNLKQVLERKGYSADLLVISTKRNKYHNRFLTAFGAAKNSQHLLGTAIDFIVFDVNGDGDCNAVDVDIVYKILDEEIIKNEGGIGTYKGEKLFWNRQMVHIDSRGSRARWSR